MAGIRYSFELAAYHIDITAAGFKNINKRTQFDTLIGINGKADQVTPVIFIFIRNRQLTPFQTKFRSGQGQNLIDVVKIIQTENEAAGMGRNTFYSVFTK